MEKEARYKNEHYSSISFSGVKECSDKIMFSNMGFPIGYRSAGMYPHDKKYGCTSKVMDV
jgi:hypothetical protein